MKVITCYLPSLMDGVYIPVSQQRFAKIRSDKESIYPIILASGATLLNNNGFKVIHIDAVMRRLSITNFLKIIEEYSPGLLIFETKTPIVKDNWKAVNIIKDKFPNLKIAVCGDHVTVLPLETMRNCMVDFVITGGDYDLGMLGVALYLRDGKSLPPGIYYRENGEIKDTGKFELIKNLDSIPFINRDIVPWFQYHEAWRLYPRFMYIMTGRGCPYKCTFCSWAQMLYEGRFRMRSVKNVIEEIVLLLKNYQVQELFIDTDTFTCPRGWVLEFCKQIIDKKIKVIWSCNGHVANVDYDMLRFMKQAGCRMIKFGVESASQFTLDKIRKNYTIEQVKKAFELCNKVGIHIHATIMFGFYWESKQDILDTVNFVKKLNPYEVQFSLPIPYPGTALYEEAKVNGWLNFKEGEWENWNMCQPIIKNKELTPQEIVNLHRWAWKSFYLNPRFIVKRLFSIRNFYDILLIFRGLYTLIMGHIKSVNN